MQRVIWILFGGLLLLGGCGFFSVKSAQNDMVELEEIVDAQWGQVQNAYQRRADLIPNLVATAKAAAEFEQQTLTGIADARAQVGQMVVSKDVLDDPQAFERFNQAQSQLGNALSRLLSVSENYPDLKTNANFRDLQAQLEGTENRINVERNKFNNQAREYNTYIKKFPSSIYANMLGFDEKPYFEADVNSQSAPQVNFDN